MNRILILSIICAVSLAGEAKAEVLAEIHTDTFANAIEISEPCPIESTECLFNAPTETAPKAYGAITLTDEEKSLLAAILWAEANNQPKEGQEACVEVVFNRMLSGEWGNGKPGQIASLESVLSQKGQFATWKYRNRVKPTAEQYEAIEAVLAEEETVLPDKTYVYFDTKGKNGKAHIRIEGHVFGK